MISTENVYITCKVQLLVNASPLERNFMTLADSDNSRLQTHTEYKTLDPVWQKVRDCCRLYAVCCML